MAFVLRRPFAVSSNAFKQISKPSSIIRAFHSSPKSNTFFNPRSSSSTSNAQSLLKSAALRNGFKRGYQTPSYQAANPAASGNLTQRLLYGGALLGGTILATNFIFNRETREDGGMPLFEREYLNQTFMHTGLGVGIIAIAARTLHQSGWSYRLMATNPWLVMGLGLAASLGTMYGTFYTHPDK
jgi:growth hormone-inducible transmembrane protein